MRILKSILMLPVVLAILALPVFATDTAFAVDDPAKQAACEGLGRDPAECTNTGSNTQINNVVAAAVNILSWVVGVAAVVMIIIGGFKYITAGGDSNSISSAKSTITYAVIGLVIAALAQVMVQFVLNKVT